mmetsp:Transcript_8985/g.21516  ORF Transcript_8985/g.21516 Transcript_8985/m.21516 type:complete len:209 (-) Transcript_8985:573-1199(-)
MPAALDGGSHRGLSKIISLRPSCRLPHEWGKRFRHDHVRLADLPSGLDDRGSTCVAAICGHCTPHGLLAVIDLGECHHALWHSDDPAGKLGCQRRGWDQTPQQQSGTCCRAQACCHSQRAVHLHLRHDLPVYADGDHVRDESSHEDAPSLRSCVGSLSAADVCHCGHRRLRLHGEQGQRDDEREPCIRAALSSGGRMHGGPYADFLPH